MSPGAVGTRKPDVWLIATHNGTFHTDEVFACAAVLLMYPQARVIRTRDPKELMRADVVLDVGGALNPDTLRFDHHQMGGAGTRANGVPYSSFGLVWRYMVRPWGGLSERVWRTIDKDLVQPIDLEDNGAGFPARQGVHPHTTRSIINGFRPTWNDHEADWDAAFTFAVEVAKVLLNNAIAHAKAEDAAGVVVQKAITNAEDPRIITLKHRNIPWRDHVQNSSVQYIIYPESHGWRVRAFSNKSQHRQFPRAWWALEDEVLITASGVPGARFCHRNGFVLGAKTLEAAEQLAKIAADT